MSGYVRQLAQQAREASLQLARSDGATRRAAIESMAAQLLARSADVLAANEEDMQRGRDAGLSAAVLDRLKLDPARLAAIDSIAARRVAPSLRASCNDASRACCASWRT